MSPFRESSLKRFGLMRVWYDSSYGGNGWVRMSWNSYRSET
jgi:hypothetical protein